MALSYDSVNTLLDELLKLHPKKIDLSLDRSFNLLKKLGDPQNKISNIIHIAGTNGKFSTLNFIKSILKNNQKSINAYISPHLIYFNERFEIQDQIISNDLLYQILSEVKNINNKDPITFFEITSAAFFKLAAENSADYTLLETGLGGRLDSSNVMIPALSVISSIAHDHHEFLGNSIEKIAFEKAGIMKSNVPAIIGYQPFEEAKDILINHANSIEVPTFVYNRDWSINKKNNIIIYEDNDFKFEFENFKNHADFQIKNLGLAIATAMKINGVQVEPFLNNNLHQSIYFPGRFEKLEKGKFSSFISKTNELYLDGSHNADAAANINQSLNMLPAKDLCIIIGMLNTKNPKEYIKQFSNICSIKTIQIPGEENSLTAQSLKDIIKQEFENVEESHSLEEALKTISNENPNARILICGSLYLAGYVLKN